jgi:hypothetical protein
MPLVPQHIAQDIKIEPVVIDDQDQRHNPHVGAWRGGEDSGKNQFRRRPAKPRLSFMIADAAREVSEGQSAIPRRWRTRRRAAVRSLSGT